ncbi:MAG: hypothetical protein IT366_18180 [Candidatus Hydrogenedentes bacterium]|nr:hypothetical protein [Candidatus Hydrogenedentota bacterium]
MRKISIGVLVCLLAIALCIPASNVKAGGGKGGDDPGYWTGTSNPVPDPHGGGWLIQAIHHDGEGLIDATVTTGTAKTKRKARKASKELAKSLEAAGQGFKWDPSCDSQLFDC